ncbi:uncharacterized protein LOC144559402 [Carex rostrata]
MVQQARSGDQWNLKLSQQLSIQAEQESTALMQELNAYLVSQEEPDQLSWKWGLNEKFTVKTSYEAMASGPFIESCNAKVWQLKAPLRILIFGWLAIKERILTTDNLTRKGWELPNICYLCRKEAESVRHLFHACEFTSLLRREITVKMPELSSCQLFQRGSFRAVILFSKHTKVRHMQLAFCFILWKERCRRLFQDKRKNVEAVGDEICQEYTSWNTLRREE